jgi:hypothetical protein
MARRTKQLVRNRARAHRKTVKAGHKMRTRTKSRGFHPATKKRRKRAARRSGRGMKLR